MLTRQQVCATIKYFVRFFAALWHVQSLENKEPSQGPSSQCDKEFLYTSTTSFP